MALAGLGALAAGGTALAGATGLLGGLTGKRGDEAGSSSSGSSAGTRDAGSSSSSEDAVAARKQQRGDAYDPAAHGFVAQDADTKTWGVIDLEGSWLIKPSLGTPPNAYAAKGTPALESSSRLWGFMGTDGSWAVAPAFSKLGPLYTSSSHGSLAAARSARSLLWGLVDDTGAWVVQPAFLAMNLVISNDRVAAQRDSAVDSWGVLDMTGAWTVEPASYTALGEAGVADGVRVLPARVGSSLWGYLKEDGGWLIEPAFARALPLRDGAAPVQIKDGDGSWQLVGTDGKRIGSTVYSGLRPLSEGLAAFLDSSTGLWGFLDAAGSVRLKPAFAALGDSHGDVAPAQDPSTRLWGLIETSGGTWLKEPTFSQIELGYLDQDQTGTTSYAGEDAS